jgi:hypothetical protein
MLWHMVVRIPGEYLGGGREGEETPQLELNLDVSDGLHRHEYLTLNLASTFEGWCFSSGATPRLHYPYPPPSSWRGLTKPIVSAWRWGHISYIGLYCICYQLLIWFTPGLYCICYQLLILFTPGLYCICYQLLIWCTPGLYLIYPWPLLYLLSAADLIYPWPLLYLLSAAHFIYPCPAWVRETIVWSWCVSQVRLADVDR